jgi:hypothetical protein
MKFCKNSTFSGSEFFIFEKIQWKSVLDTGFGYENSNFFSAYEFFISEKIKWKSVLGSKKDVFWEEIRKLRAKIIFLVSYKNSWNSTKTAVFQGANMVTIFSQTPRSLHFLGYALYIYTFPMSDFLRKCLAGENFWRNCCENRTKIKHKKQNFWTKMLRKSYFL